MDSDADGIHDVIEGGNEDYNGNGEVGGDDEPVDSNGNPVAANDNPTPDTDGDGIPDSMELDSDNDGLSDSNECPGGSPCRDLDNDGKKDFQDVDRDGDGIEDQYECPDGDSADCLDTDNDDLPDIDDLDSDNDGLSDRFECPDGYECPDTDGDGIPNYLDTDSDGDGLSDTNECPDGVNCPDSDGDGIPNYLDSDCAIVIETPVLLVNNPVCEGEDIILSLEDPSSIENAFPNNEIVFIWKNGNGDLLPLFTSGDHILKTDDLKAVSPYTVLAYVGNCPSDVSNAVDVVITPLVEANIIVPDTAVCQGSNVLLAANPVNGASYSWVNLNNNEEISTIPFVDINNIDETINVQLTMQIEGCASTDSDMVEVSLYPNPEIASVSDDGLYCEGDVVVLSAEIVDTLDPVTFTWTGPNNFEFSGSSMSEFNTIINNISLNQSGTYQIQLESLEGCLSDPMNVEVAVQPTSSPAIFASENVICEGGNLEIRTDSISGDVVYQWLKNGIPLDTTNVPFLNINSSIDGKYSVLVESSACTSDVSAEVEVEMIQSNIETNILNITSELTPICEGENIELSIINPNPEVLYQWFDANDNLLNEGISLIFNEIQKENEGSYFVKGTINGCEIPEANTEVFVVNQTMIQPIIDDNSLVICEGLNLELNISNPIDIDSTETIEYVWYYNGNQIETTNEPSLMLNALTSSQSGNYSVVVSSSGCMGIESENVVVVVNDVPDDVIALVGEDNRICNESSFLLTAQPLTNGSGYWTAIDGGNINDVTSDTTSVSGLSEGVYHFVWTIDYESCIGLDSDTLTLNVGEANEIAKTEDDRKICISDVDNVILNATQPTIGTGQWEQISGTDVVISNPNNSNTEISDLSLGEYAFVWTLSDGDCIDYSVDTIHVLVKDIPDEVATIYDDYWESCSPNQVTISAEVPTESTGYWEVLNEGEILSESSPGTVVSGLANGENILIWKLVDDACGEFSQDTMKIKVFDMVLPEDDSFTVIVGDTIDESVTGNDFIGNVETVNYGIYIAPEHGTVSIASNGSFKYIPEEGYFGEDLFVYSMTNVFCGQQELAKVRIRIQNNIDPNICNIPNLITPNGDQSNDFLKIDCAPVLPENHLVIFNRWGDKIFEAAPYLNDWNGQLKGDKLPSGTYYYIFKRYNLDSTPMTGYISILR